jgi:hypothetical protein
MKKILSIIIIILSISLFTTSAFAGRRHRHHHRRHNNGIAIGIISGLILGSMFNNHRSHRRYYRHRPHVCTYERKVYEIDEFGDRYYLGTEYFKDYCR